jgi:Leucine-rich repeat (LRR) protein
MDVADHGVDLVKLLNGEMSELKDFFKPEFARGLTLDGTSLKIDSFSHGAIGKFVGLYGIHDLFENLPTSLETLTIKNNEKNDIIIHIPDDIDRFSNLNFLHFENCIDSLPETICNLKKLRFLTVQNNPKLRTVPGCIVNLPDLVFLNAKECPNLQVPKEIQDKGADFGNGMWDFTDDED